MLTSLISIGTTSYSKLHGSSWNWPCGLLVPFWIRVSLFLNIPLSMKTSEPYGLKKHTFKMKINRCQIYCTTLGSSLCTSIVTKTTHPTKPCHLLEHHFHPNPHSKPQKPAHSIYKVNSVQSKVLQKLQINQTIWKNILTTVIVFFLLNFVCAKCSIKKPTIQTNINQQQLMISPCYWTNPKLVECLNSYTYVWATDLNFHYMKKRGWTTTPRSSTYPIFDYIHYQICVTFVTITFLKEETSLQCYNHIQSSGNTQPVVSTSM